MRTDTCRHLVGMVMDSTTPNPLFQAPLKNPQVPITLSDHFLRLDLNTDKISVFSMSVLVEGAGQCESPTILTLR